MGGSQSRSKPRGEEKVPCSCLLKAVKPKSGEFWIYGISGYEQCEKGFGISALAFTTIYGKKVIEIMPIRVERTLPGFVSNSEKMEVNRNKHNYKAEQLITWNCEKPILLKGTINSSSFMEPKGSLPSAQKIIWTTWIHCTFTKDFETSIQKLISYIHQKTLKYSRPSRLTTKLLNVFIVSRLLLHVSPGPTYLTWSLL
jgi:hypothetical protein